MEDDLVVAEVLRYRFIQKRLGTRKLYQEMQPFLAAHGIKMGRDALFGLLADRNLLVRKRRNRKPITTLSRHRYRKYPNLIKGYDPIAPNHLWVSDITYISVADGYAYLSLITDAYSRKIVGYCLRKDLQAAGPLSALQMALSQTPDTSLLIHHSDRGTQYCCYEYEALLTHPKNRIKMSMTETGDPLENAIAERVNGILKGELLQEHYPDYETAAIDIQVAVNTYNYLRPHSSINYLKPFEAHQTSGALPRKWKNYYIIKKRKEEPVKS